MTRSSVVKIVALVALVASLGLLLTQVEVSESSVEATRTCGSAFDSAIDRSGWDQWWASDLDEPDPSVRSALVRTRQCPDAVNKRLAVAALLGAVAVVSAVVVRAGDGSVRRAPTTVGDRIARLGRASTWTGLLLSFAGVIALVVLVADADSTLFLYTDRFVVAVVGLIVLTPTIALFVIGRALAIIGAHLGDENPESDDAQIA